MHAYVHTPESHLFIAMKKLRPDSRPDTPRNWFAALGSFASTHPPPKAYVCTTFSTRELRKIDMTGCISFRDSRGGIQRSRFVTPSFDDMLCNDVARACVASHLCRARATGDAAAAACGGDERASAVLVDCARGERCRGTVRPHTSCVAVGWASQSARLAHHGRGCQRPSGASSR